MLTGMVAAGTVGKGLKLLSHCDTIFGAPKSVVMGKKFQVHLGAFVTKNDGTKFYTQWDTGFLGNQTFGLWGYPMGY